jgi:TPR repeat protein
MGTYGVMFMADADGNPLGFFTLYTNVGNVVMIFGDMDSLAEATVYAQRRVTDPGSQLGVMQITADSPSQVVHMFEQDSPEWTAETSFVTNGEELFEALMTGLREQNAVSAEPGTESGATEDTVNWQDSAELAEQRAWWTRAAEAGHTAAQYNLGVLLADRLDPPELAEARVWWTRAAGGGHIEAQYRLGVLLATMLDPPELAKALTWWTRAAEAGHTNAQYNLGVLLATKLDPPALAKARTWWTRAAEAGHTGAQNALSQFGDG